MIRKLVNLFAAVSLTSAAMLSSSVKADANNYVLGDDLIKLCESTNLTNHAGCLWYILGVYDAQVTAQSEKIKAICVPERVSGDELQRVVVKWLNENPENSHFSASSDVLAAIQKSFPCKQSNNN